MFHPVPDQDLVSVGQQTLQPEDLSVLSKYLFILVLWYSLELLFQILQAVFWEVLTPPHVKDVKALSCDQTVSIV